MPNNSLVAEAITGQARLIQEPSYIPVIAEIGINHNGDINIAGEMIRGAAAAGCDVVKFQKRTVTTVYPAPLLESPRESPWGTTQRDQKEGLELDNQEYFELKDEAESAGVLLAASAWDLESLEFVESLDPPFHKIASAMMTHSGFLREVASTGRPIIASTGMMTIEDIEKALDVLRHSSAPIILLHTVSLYPCPEDLLNLMAIPMLAEHFGLPVGYSGHEPSLSPSILAMGLGAVMLERHVTTNRTMYGSDQAASLEMRGLRDLVSAARKWPASRGNGEKRVMPGEEEVARKLRYWE